MLCTFWTRSAPKKQEGGGPFSRGCAARRSKPPPRRCFVKVYGRPRKMSTHTQPARARQSRIRAARIRRTHRIEVGIESPSAGFRSGIHAARDSILSLRASPWRLVNSSTMAGGVLSVVWVEVPNMRCLMVPWPGKSRFRALKPGERFLVSFATLHHGFCRRQVSCQLLLTHSVSWSPNGVIAESQ